MTYDPTKHADIVYSPDDESATGKGWYCSRHDGQTTPLYRKRHSACVGAIKLWPGVELHTTDASYAA